MTLMTSWILVVILSINIDLQVPILSQDQYLDDSYSLYDHKFSGNDYCGFEDINMTDSIHEGSFPTESQIFGCSNYFEGFSP